jgi:DNA (cytosine-5)-methyltransferase 1
MPTNKIIKCFDLFSGIGGFRQGVNEATSSLSLDTKWVGRCDIDPYANKLYDHCFNINDELLLNDITEITGSLNPKTTNDPKTIDKINAMLPDFDLLTGGFPCQAFSSMGKRQGLQDPRGTLFYAIELIIRAKKPTHFILENVRGLLNIDNKNTIKTMRAILDGLGYNIAIWLLNASDYGLPQTRRRVFIVGSKSNMNINDDNKPLKTNRRAFKTTWHLLENEVDNKYYLSEKIKKTILSDGTGGYKYKADYNLLTSRPLTFTMHKMHRASQDNYYSDSFINGKYQKKSNSVIECDEGKNNIRRITPKEALLLQGFNKSFINKALKSGLSDTRLYMLAGNSVPTKLVKAAAQHLLEID